MQITMSLSESTKQWIKVVLHEALNLAVLKGKVFIGR